MKIVQNSGAKWNSREVKQACEMRRLKMRLEKLNFNRLLQAFTLLEVMIATAIFFMAMFSILALVSQSLRSARSLSRNTPTPGMAAAISGLVMTNKLEEGSEDGDFGDLYPDYSWSSDTIFYGSNGLFQVNFTVYRDGKLDSSISTLMFKPESTTGIGVRSRFQ